MFIDIIVEFLFEVLAEGFVSLCDAFVPRKLRSAKSRLILTVVFLVLATFLFAGLVFGIITLVENCGKSLLGWMMVGLSAAYVSCGLLLKLLRNAK